MKTSRSVLGIVLAATAALLAAEPARAALLDKGPADPVLVWPQWYRDLDGTAVGLCKSQVQSPNAAAALGSMCFPLAPDPNAFAGNIGDEVFYNNLTVLIGKGGSSGGASGFAMKYVAALEAAYVPGPGPKHGEEAVFARIRVVMSAAVPGTYVVTHPFGVEVFPDVEPGPRAVFYTVDIPLGIPGDFAGALDGRVGPFIQWDVVNPGETLTVGNEQFLGDPNYDHTYTGSPFGTNFVRVDGPPGSNLDGAGNDFVETSLGTVLGQRWTAPIPTAFNVQKAVYTRDAVNNTVDVWASSAPGQKLVLTGQSLPSIQLQEFPAGQYYGHVEESAELVPPASVTVTNLSSNPVISTSIGVTDQLDATATFDSASRALSLSATSSDLSGPTLTVLGPSGGVMTPGAAAGTYAYAAIVPAGVEPPRTVKVESNAGGIYVANVVVLAGAPMNVAGQPVANDDFPTVAGSGSTPLALAANDLFAGSPTILILSQPATGTVTASTTPGTVAYTPTPGASGADSFTYAIQDAIGISNVATVSFTVTFVAPPPTALADSFAMQQNGSRTYAVLANDSAATGTLMDPASIQITQGPRGVAVANPDGTITFTPPANTVAVFTFSYTVANTAGTRSGAATVTVVVFGGPESVSISKAIYTRSKAKWNIVGSTNWFAPTLTQLTATCWTGVAAAPTAATLIGSAPVDTAGKFAVVPAGATPVPVSPSSVTCQTSSGGFGRAGVQFQ